MQPVPSAGERETGTTRRITYSRCQARENVQTIQDAVKEITENVNLQQFASITHSCTNTNPLKAVIYQ